MIMHTIELKQLSLDMGKTEFDMLQEMLFTNTGISETEDKDGIQNQDRCPSG